MPAKRRPNTVKQRPAFKRLKKLVDLPGPKDLMWYFHAGMSVEKLCPDRDYGESKIESVVKALGQPKSFAQTLWSARKIAREYDKDRVKQLSQPVKGSSYRLTRSHMIHLLSLITDRRAFEDDCVRNEWSTKELEDQIHRHQGRQGHGGRKYQKPVTLEDGLRQLIKVSADWNRRCEQIWFHREEPAIDLDSKTASTSEVAELCREAVEVLESVQNGIKQRLPVLLYYARPKPKTKKTARRKKKVK